MNRQAIVRVLLSLLLLMSQQMALAHSVTHWAGSLHDSGPLHLAQQQVDSDGDLSAAIAQDQACQQCLAFAQLVAPLASALRSCAAADTATAALAATLTQAACARTVCVFHSRAPPQA